MSELPIPVHASDLRTQGAFNGTSHTPESRERSWRQGYVEEIQEFWAEVAPKLTDENREGVIYEFKLLVEGYRSRLNAYFAAHSRVMSSFITGPANFPVSRNQKRIDTADRRLGEAIEFAKKGRARVLKALRGPRVPMESEERRLAATVDRKRPVHRPTVGRA